MAEQLTLIGDELQTPFEGAGDAADEIVAAGTAQIDAVEQLAVVEPTVYDPDASVRQAYDEAYGRYRGLFDALEPGWMA